MNELSLIYHGFPPPQMVILGPPGSGKTVTVKKVLNDTKISYVYVVSEMSAYATLIRIGEILVGRRLWGLSFGLAWADAEKYLKKNTIIILDEAEKFMMNDPRSDELLYYLSRKTELGLILISNRMNLLDYVRDGRVRSSLKPIVKTFKPYNAEELANILRLRASDALGEDYGKVIESGIFNLISALAMKRGGDARFAIDLLRESLKIAILEGKESITADHVQTASNIIEENELRNTIKSLSRVHKLLLLASLGRKSAREAYSLYNILTKEYGMSPLSERRLREVLGDLELMGFVSLRRMKNAWIIEPASWFLIEKAKAVLEEELRTG